MNKLIALLTLVGISASVQANGYHYYRQPTFQVQHHHHHSHGRWRHSHHGGWEWVVPAVIGGVIVWQATRPPEPQVVVQQQVVVPDPNGNCSPWTEIQNADGTITRTRTCSK